MKHQHIAKRIMVAIGLVLLVGTYINFSSPGRVVVRDTGEVVGILNNLREEFQGNQFWRDQLQEVNRELERALSEPEREAVLQRKFSQLDDELKRDEERMYREHPELRPTAEERQAEALRNRADALEMASLDRELEQFRIERIAELRRIKRRVEVLAEWPFGTDFKPADQLFFDQIEAEAAANDDIQRAAKANNLDDFRLVFDKALDGLFIDRMDGNEDIFRRVMQDTEFRAAAAGYLINKVYQ